jgi:ABC-type nitrate/sulfonate/bicarbonate transport system substrate-binding protein
MMKIILALLTLFVLHAVACAADKITIGVPELNAQFVPLALAEKKGFFREVGIQADVIRINPTVALAALVSGELDYLDGHRRARVHRQTVTSKYVRERRPVVRSFVQAYAEGLQRFVNDRDFSIRVIQKYMRVNEKDLLDDAYDFYAPRVQKIPYPTLKGIKFILDSMAEAQPRARNVAPESFVDLSLLQELDQSGFFKQLWKN